MSVVPDGNVAIAARFGTNARAVAVGTLVALAGGMRALTLFALLVAGCGVADTPTMVSCNDLADELAMTAKENARCIDDAQCRFIDDACLDGCALFANADGVAAAQPILDEANAARCNTGCSCQALRPACRDGRCVLWTPPPP